MKKTFLLFLTLSAISVAKPRVITVTPNLEIGGALSNTVSSSGESGSRLSPSLGAAFEVKSTINKERLYNNLLDKFDVEVGAGIKQDFDITDAKAKQVYGSTTLYMVAESDYEITKELSAYIQTKGGVGVDYGVTDNAKFAAKGSSGNYRALTCVIATIGGGMEYKNFRAGIEVGLNGGIGLDNFNKFSPKLKFGVKLGYDIPVAKF